MKALKPLYDAHTKRLEIKLSRIRQVARDLVNVGGAYTNWKGSPVTTLDEDGALVALGNEQLRIGRQLLRILED